MKLLYSLCRTELGGNTTAQRRHNAEVVHYTKDDAQTLAKVLLCDTINYIQCIISPLGGGTCIVPSHATKRRVVFLQAAFVDSQAILKLAVSSQRLATTSQAGLISRK